MAGRSILHISETGSTLKDRTTKAPAILIAMPYLTMGGAEASVSQICRQLRAHGIRIFLITTQAVQEDQGDTSAWFADSVEEICHLPRGVDPVNSWPEFLRALIRREQVDLLWQVGSTFVYSLLPQLRAWFPELAVVDLLFNPEGHTQDHLRYARFIDHVVVEHEGMRSWLREHGVPAAKLSIIANAIDVDRYSPQPRLDWRTNAPRTTADGRFVVAFLGRLSDEKGPDIFVEIVAELREDRRMEFLLCGTGPLEASLRNLARKKGLEEYVHFLGRVSTHDVLPCCDAVVVCSRLDGRPNIVLESLAMGIPVVASRVGGIPDLLPPEYAAALCEPGDVTAFARAIRALADDEQLRKNYSAAARKHAEQHFSIAQVGTAYASLFERLRSQRRRFRALRRVPGLAASAMQAVKTPPKNAYLMWRLYRSSAWSDVLRHFDRAYYARENPAVRRWGVPALLHYVFWGSQQGRDPSPQFHTYSYLSANPDVARLGLNPLLHYVAFGREEGRKGGPAEAAPAQRC